MNDDQLKQLWRDQAMSTASFSIAELKVKAKRMHRQIALRNAREYVACVLVISAFSSYVVEFPSPLMRAGSVLTVLATIFVMWQLKRRGSNQALPTERGDQSWLQFQRSQLVRQRDALQSAWLWYVAPFLPGVVLFRWGVETELAPHGHFARGWLANLFIGVVFLGIAALNRYAARKLQQRIDSLDQQTG